MAPTTHSDEQIIRLLREDDQQAVSALVAKYGDALLGVLVKMVNQRETAEDLLQEVFVKAWKNKRSYNEKRGRLFTWLINIARNTAIDYLRIKKNQIHRQSANLDTTVYEVDDRLGSEEMQVADVGLQKAVAQLDEKYRQIIDLLYLQGYSQREITKEFDIPLGTVKTRAIAAIRELRKLLGSDALLIGALLLSWLLWSMFSTT